MHKAEHIRSRFSSTWSEILHQKIQLECSDEETRYLTPPLDAIMIQREIAKFEPAPRHFVDAFACIGGDSLAAMLVHPAADVWAIQRAKSVAEKERFGRLETNLRRFRRTVDRTGRVCWYASDIGNFLMHFKDDISVLFLDPPWAVGPDPDVISPAEEIRAFLGNNVFRHLQTRPRYICLKLPHSVEDSIEQWPRSSAAGYRLVRSIHVRRRYFVYILQRL